MLLNNAQYYITTLPHYHLPARQPELNAAFNQPQMTTRHIVATRLLPSGHDSELYLRQNCTFIQTNVNFYKITKTLRGIDGPILHGWNPVSYKDPPLLWRATWLGEP